MKRIRVIAAASLMLLGLACTETKQNKQAKEMKQEDYLTFKLSDKVTREQVTYRNRYGITIAADLYLPKDINTTKKYAALIVGTPYGGVKEQGAGIYAQSMAERGFVAIAFDESYNGESGGEPRRISSPEIFVEDFSASVDYIGTRLYVDRNKIGVIGLCGSGGFSISAAQVDRRIKAVATVSMYDMSRVKREGFKGSLTEEERNKYLDQIGEQRWTEFEGGKVKMNLGTPETIDENTDPISREFAEYYRTPRGQHPNSNTEFTMTSDFSFMNFPLLNNIKSVSPRPILFIIGEHAHSRYFSEDAYALAAEPKELYIVPGAGHVDLYDRTDLIPFGKLETFFKEYLK
ncbi:alpha/beta hydrolase [Niabella sp.]|uniref:alpha/beta hydrolase n=1 Tax=Niabella sp. TaxID=1962976 RepID=UPI0026187A70|nr:alpha/beta hydrolase [Niabella sp.]